MNDDETAVNFNPSAFNLNGLTVSERRFNVTSKTTFFDIPANRAFYDSITEYDTYVQKNYSITFKDVAGNVKTVNDFLEIRKTDADKPVINSWTANGSVDALIEHLGSNTQTEHQSIDVILAADVSDERLNNMYYTTTKNGTLLQDKLVLVYG